MLLLMMKERNGSFENTSIMPVAVLHECMKSESGIPSTRSNPFAFVVASSSPPTWAVASFISARKYVLELCVHPQLL